MPATDQPLAAPPVQVIAMHGWAGDSRSWRPWQQASAPLGWQWRCAERGYGDLPAQQPSWGGQGRRLLITHSMGHLLLPAAVLAEAELVVLLTGFARFIPDGPAGRRQQTAVAGMLAQLSPMADDEPEAQQAERARALLQTFLAEAASPAPATELPHGPADGPIGACGRARLHQDLGRLQGCLDLPEGFPEHRPVLCVEAGQDRIITPEARLLLRQRLPQAGRQLLPEAGHALLRTPVIATVLEWVEAVLSA